jgi:hypothetical protein
MLVFILITGMVWETVGKHLDFIMAATLVLGVSFLLYLAKVVKPRRAYS